MKAQHTPGPWQIVVDRHPHHGGGEHTERRIFTMWDHPQMKGPIGVVNGSCGIGAKKGGRARHMVSISEPDALLIAAAPDLKDALSSIEGRIEEAARYLNNTKQWDDPDTAIDGDGSLLDWIFRDVRAAIAKAEGRAE